MLHSRQVSGDVKHFLLRLALLALLSLSVLAGASEQKTDERPASWTRNSGETTAPSTTVTGAKGIVSLSPNLIVGLFVGSALFSFTLRFMLQGRHRRPGSCPPVLDLSDRHAPAPSDLMRLDVHLLTPAEREFFAILEPLSRPACRISIKVRLADLFEVRPERGRQTAFDLISNKHIGFIVTELETGRIVCGIELDDLTHRQAGRAGYDAFVNRLFASQQLPLVRVSCSHRHDPAALRRELAGIFGKAHAG